MPTFKSISKSNKPNNSIVNYAINDVNTVAIVTKDGEIIDKKDVLVTVSYTHLTLPTNSRV